MANYVRNFGLELPVYHQWTHVAWTTEQIKRQAKSPRRTFVRRAMLSYSGALSLKGALAAADADMFQIAATYDDIEVVNHEWGLSRRQPSKRVLRYDHWRFDNTNNLVPEGYNLVAKVDVVPNMSVDRDTEIYFARKLSAAFYDDSYAGPKMSNLGMGQLAYRREIGGTTTATIVDIDPILKS